MICYAPRGGYHMIRRLRRRSHTAPTVRIEGMSVIEVLSYALGQRRPPACAVRLDERVRTVPGPPRRQRARRSDGRLVSPGI
jgi:hypothetical protein